MIDWSKPVLIDGEPAEVLRTYGDYAIAVSHGRHGKPNALDCYGPDGLARFGFTRASQAAEEKHYVLVEHTTGAPETSETYRSVFAVSERPPDRPTFEWLEHATSGLTRTFKGRHGKGGEWFCIHPIDALMEVVDVDADA